MSEPAGTLPGALPDHLPVEELGPGPCLLRIHDSRQDPIWYGPAVGRPPTHRFDDPRGHYRTLYAAPDEMAAFAETFLRDRPRIRIMSMRETTRARISRLVAVRELRLAALHGPGLARLGAESSVASGPYRISRAWARAIWEHGDEVDGIVYRARHDDDAFAVAVFDREPGLLEAAGRPEVLDRRFLTRMADRYGFGLTR